MAEAVEARASGTKVTAKNARARSAIQQDAANRYKVIFQVEAVLRGLISDAQMFPLLLTLHRRMIERPLRKLNDVNYTPWTLQMLQEHFDVDNEHVFDKVRELARDSRLVRKTIKQVADNVTVPDPDNPARRVVDVRAVGALDKLISTHRRVIQALETTHKTKDEDLSNAIFTLVSAISRQKPDADSVIRDPRAAAGTVAMGGDTRESVAIDGTTAIGTAYDMFALSGY